MNSSAAKIAPRTGFLAAAALALSMSACTHNSSDLHAYVADVKARPGGKIDDGIDPIKFPPIPELTRGKDPFESFIVAEEDTPGPTHSPEPPWPGHNPEELERFALDSLRMVGTVEHAREQYGLIRDPDGIVHRVRVGNYIGKNYGKIVEVSEDRIALVEKVSDSRGRWDDRDAAISLSD